MSRKRKIAFVVQRYGLEVNGGAELHCRQYAERLCDIYDVEVITTKAIDYLTWADEYEKDEEIINGVLVRRFSVDFNRDSAAFDRYSTYIFNRKKKHSFEEEEKWIKMQGPYSSSMLDYISDHRDDYEVFIFMTFLYPHTFFGLPLVKNKAILIPTAHDEPLIYLRPYRVLFNMPAGIFYNTVSEKRITNTIMRNNWVYDNGGLGGTGIEAGNSVSFDVIRIKYNIDDYVVYVGRITEGKGCDKLFHYFLNYIDITHSNIKLVLVGKNDMQIPESSNIIHLGFIDEAEKNGVIKYSKALIIPSKFESLSMVLLEAMAMGVPVLANGRCEVLRDHCIMSNAGLYYSSGKEFSVMLDFLLNNNDICKEMGKNGRKYIEDNYRWGDIISRLSEMIETTATGGHTFVTEQSDEKIKIVNLISDIRKDNGISDDPYEFDDPEAERFGEIGLDDFYSHKKQNDIFREMIYQYDNAEEVAVSEGERLSVFKRIRNKLFASFSKLVFKKQDRFNRLVLEMINEILIERYKNFNG